MGFSALLIALYIALLPSSSYTLQCKDEDGKSVDWFIAYKLPKHEQNNDPYTGLKYVYSSSELTSSSWVAGKYPITDEKSIFAQSLSSLYGAHSSKLNFLLYSDQPPKGEPGSGRGHSKGALLFDQDSGLWLTHSVPGFPIDPESGSHYEYPTTGIPNGQSLLCISFKTKSLEDITTNLLYIRPHIYAFSIDPTVQQTYPQLDSLINKKWIKKGISQRTLQTIGGQSFMTFGKSPTDFLDIYSEVLAPTLSTSMLAETWRKGAGTPLPSACNTTYSVQNIKELSIDEPGPSIEGARGTWSYTEDHSKWAIGIESAKPFVCIGDLNRMRSQFRRGGGAVCFRNNRIWNIMNQSIREIEPCPRRQRKKLSRRVYDKMTRIFG
ncbi:deoxyribonuclease-2-beta-like [Brevipalpus obovatus]|uniref:deoxyribonuclease-2-beta-like n=1 Tax=Brevipalpus obovatus TaxID=246614 RepID=UPI003D9E9FB8